MNIKSYIIHLARASDRRQQVQRLKEQAPVQAEVIDAVDGKTLAAETIEAVYRRLLHKPHYPFELRIAEIACFLSHRKCWQSIVDQNLDAALILEDDVEIDENVFSPAFDLAMQNYSPDVYVRFPQKQREVAASTLATTSTHRLIVPKVTNVGMQGQLVGIGAARTLLDNTRQFDRPVDTLLQMTWLTEVQPTSVYPSGISERSAQLGGSCIGKRKSWREVVKREILRPLYRRKLASFARRYQRMAS